MGFRGVGFLFCVVLNLDFCFFMGFGLHVTQIEGKRLCSGYGIFWIRSSWRMRARGLPLRYGRGVRGLGFRGVGFFAVLKLKLCFFGALICMLHN